MRTHFRALAKYVFFLPMLLFSIFFFKFNLLQIKNTFLGCIFTILYYCLCRLKINKSLFVARHKCYLTFILSAHEFYAQFASKITQMPDILKQMKLEVEVIPFLFFFISWFRCKAFYFFSEEEIFEKIVCKFSLWPTKGCFVKFTSRKLTKKIYVFRVILPGRNWEPESPSLKKKLRVAGGGWRVASGGWRVGWWCTRVLESWQKWIKKHVFDLFSTKMNGIHESFRDLCAKRSKLEWSPRRVRRRWPALI